MMPATIALTELLEREDIHLGFQADSVLDAIPRLLRSPLMRRGLSPAMVDEIVAAVIRREQESSTVCGFLLLPHVRFAGVSEFVFSVAANMTGVIAGRPEPRLTFAFVSPEGKREQHLHLLAALARLARNREYVDRIAGAANADQAIDALRDAGV